MRNQVIKMGFFLLAFLFVGINLNAQGQGRGQRPAPPTAEERAKNLDDLATKLSLNEEQKTKVGELEEQLFADTQKLRQSGDRSTMRDKMMALRSSHSKALKEVLSKDQFKQWRKIEEAKRSQRGPRGGGNK